MAELQELQATITNIIGTTKYGDAVEHVDTLINQERNEDERDKLKLIKNCLIGGNDDSMHIPQNLVAGMAKPSMRRSFATFTCFFSTND